MCPVLHGDVGDKAANEEKEAGEENDGEDEILRWIVDDGLMKGRRHVATAHVGGIVEPVITLDSDPLSYAKAKTGHCTETGCNRRYEAHDGEKTDPIEKERDNTRTPSKSPSCTLAARPLTMP